MREIISKELKQSFRPEFLNRIDDIIIFHSLREEDVEKIVRIMISDLSSRLARLGIDIEVTDETVKHISKAGFDPVYGARPLERTITKEIEDQLAEAILSGVVSKDKKIQIDYDGEKLVFK